MIPLIGTILGCSGVTGLSMTPGGTAIAHGTARDPVAILSAQDAPLARRNPDLLKLKRQEMASSPFAFFRGSAVLFYWDAKRDTRLSTAVTIPLQGDFHLENLGTYRTGSGQVAYDLNDFDEAFTGPYLWELARCAVSIRLAIDENSDLTSKDADELNARFIEATFGYLEHYASQPSELSEPLTVRNLVGPAGDVASKAASKGRPEFLSKLTEAGRFKSTKKLRPVDDSTRLEILEAVKGYATGQPGPAGFFRVKDVAERVAGVASLGRFRFAALIEGPTTDSDDDYVLELKEALPPAGGTRSRDDAERVRDAYRYFLPDADPLLGVTRFRGQGMLVRELQPAKDGVDLAKLKSKKAFAYFLDDAARVAARAMARSGQGRRILADARSEEILAARVGAVSLGYVERVKSDYKAFRASR